LPAAEEAHAGAGCPQAALRGFQMDQHLVDTEQRSQDITAGGPRRHIAHASGPRVAAHRSFPGDRIEAEGVLAGRVAAECKRREGRFQPRGTLPHLVEIDDPA